MECTRRDLVRAGAAGMALAGADGVARATAGPAVVIYDSRLAKSRALAAAHGGPRIDVAAEAASRWAAMRAALPAGRIVGLTGWSDHIIATGYAAEQHRRLRHSEQRGGLIYWEMG